jgi:hypothetical protein
MSFRRAIVIAAFVIVGVSSFAAGTVAQLRFSQVNQAGQALGAALWHLERAPNGIFGPHKQRAEELIRDAMRQLDAAKAWAGSRGY